MTTQNNSAKRALGPVFGVKMLITAASLAGTLGGWFLLSNASGVQSVKVASTSPSGWGVTLNVPALPTVVPPPQGGTTNSTSMFNSAPNFFQTMPFGMTRSSR